MQAAGIVAEYNPFHHGHLLPMQAAQGEGRPVVVVMSGDFVQRGTPAVFSKFARAEAAVRCGASLVLELPLPWSLSSAEGFARGAVGLLAATGVVDTLVFGSESGDAETILRCAQALEQEGTGLRIREELHTGISYAAARERAVKALWGEELARVLRSPNDLLGVEYCKAILRGRLPLRPETIRRETSQHDGENSAAFLREKLQRGESIRAYIPLPAAEVYSREKSCGRGPVTPERLRLPLISRLRSLPLEAFAVLPDAGEGLENRLYRAAREETDLESMAMAAKSKRYALSRLRRMLTCAALGVERGMADGLPPYIRVLAMDKTGQSLLASMRERAHLPVVLRPARLREERARQIISLGAAAHDLYVLGYVSLSEQRGGADWRTHPFIEEK